MKNTSAYNMHTNCCWDVGWISLSVEPNENCFLCSKENTSWQRECHFFIQPTLSGSKIEARNQCDIGKKLYQKTFRIRYQQYLVQKKCWCRSQNFLSSLKTSYPYRLKCWVPSHSVVRSSISNCSPLKLT